MNGRIIKGIAGFYYVSAAESGILYECKAKGIFRKDGKKPLVGDLVRIRVLDEAAQEASVEEILPRKNALIRPAVANVDQAMVIFSIRNPAPNRALLDRFLIMMECQEIPVVLCLNKSDLAEGDELSHLAQIYRNCGYDVICCSTREESGIAEIRAKLEGRTTVVAGPSGVGKSSLSNLLQTEIQMETGEISRKLQRGRHTTRHAQLLPVGKNTYLMDTPGFTSLYTAEMKKEELRLYFPEFRPYEGQCRFLSCVHLHEPDCRVREALAEGKISRERYENYQLFYEELREKEKKKY